MKKVSRQQVELFHSYDRRRDYHKKMALTGPPNNAFHHLRLAKFWLSMMKYLIEEVKNENSG